MEAELLSVGTELLLGDILNTNARYISRKLAELGINVYFHTTVGDNKERLKKALEIADQRAKLIITTGGLGPTGDDLTKETLAEHLRLPLMESEQELEVIKSYFASRGLPWVENNRKQASNLPGGDFLRNEVGTAPGIAIQAQGHYYILLPGPPWEMEPMFEKQALPWLKKHCLMPAAGGLFSYILKFTGISESKLEEQLQDLLAAQTEPTIAPLATDNGIHLRLTARATSYENFLGLIEPVLAEIKSRLGIYVAAEREETSLQRIAGRLTASGVTVSTAESCTGGLLGASLTEIPGSSHFYKGSVIAYHNDIKEKILGIPGQLLREKGAVSAEVAAAMALNVRELFGTEVGLGITGLAGPDGGSPDKPVGLVYIAFDTRTIKWCQRYILAGERQKIRLRSVAEAQKLLERYLNTKYE